MQDLKPELFYSKVHVLLFQEYAHIPNLSTWQIYTVFKLHPKHDVPDLMLPLHFVDNSNEVT